jgi:hypothetical protein
MLHRLALLAAGLGVLAVLASGCGGDDSGSSTTQWADDLCSAITTWTGSLSDATSSLQKNLSRAGIESAVDDARTATRDLVDDLKGLGAPDTQAGADAQDAVDQLAANLSADVDDAQTALENASTLGGAISAVTNALSTMSNQVTSTFTQLEQLDVRGELEQAFKDADSCRSLAD